MSAKVTVSEGQTLIDIALAKLGDATRVFDVAAANGMKITDKIDISQPLNVPTDVDVSKKYIVDAVAKGNPLPASTDYNKTTQNAGVGFWKIGDDFKVS